MTSEKYAKCRRSVIVINSKDNVAVALRDLKPGESGGRWWVVLQQC